MKDLRDLKDLTRRLDEAAGFRRRGREAGGVWVGVGVGVKGGYVGSSNNLQTPMARGRST